MRVVRHPGSPRRLHDRKSSVHTFVKAGIGRVPCRRRPRRSLQGLVPVASADSMRGPARRSPIFPGRRRRVRRTRVNPTTLSALRWLDGERASEPPGAPARRQALRGGRRIRRRRRAFCLRPGRTRSMPPAAPCGRLGEARMRRASSKPFIPGSPMSRKATSGRRLRANGRARPGRCMHTRPRDRRAPRIIATEFAASTLSSTTRIRLGVNRGSAGSGVRCVLASRSGRRTWNFAPPSGPSLDTVTCPPCISTNRFTTERPIPSPPCARSRVRSPCTKRSKMVDCKSGGMPTPLSRDRYGGVIAIVTNLDVNLADRSVYFAALFRGSQRIARGAQDRR